MSSFKTSINIKFDFGKNEVINRYLPTPSHAETLKGLLNGFNDKNSKSHILVGPYGTGKSLLGTVVGSLVSKSISKDSENLLIEKFNNVDDNKEIYEYLKILKDKNKTYLPLILTGNEGRLRYTIVSNLINTLEKQGIDIIVPGVINKIFSTIDTWEEKYPDTYNSFLKLVESAKIDFEVWKKKVIDHDSTSINWFKEIFPTLTSGTEFTFDLKDDFSEQMKFVLDKLEKNNLGLFLIYDEFGRFMQNIDKNGIYETMEDLQDLTELANNHSNSFHILLISHRNMIQYAIKFNEDLKYEFDKIEKRFKVYKVKSDKSTYVRLSHEYLKGVSKKEVTPTHTKKIDLGLRQFSFFPELQPVEQDTYVKKGSFPLHPVTLYLIPFLSNVYAQNERTLFTFLESDDKGGLIKHINKNKGWYEPDQLFDFFYPSIENDKSSDVLQVYKKIISRHSLKKNEKKALKFIALWRLAEQESDLNITTELISFAFLWEESKTIQILNELKVKKIIRFNNNIKCWELFEGSTIDVEEKIKSEEEKTILSNEEKLDGYHYNLKKRYFLSLDYNDDKSITRFATVKFIYAKDILSEKFDAVSFRQENEADAIIINVLTEQGSDKKNLVNKIKSNNDPFTYYCLPDFSNTDDKIKSLHVIKVLLNDKTFLQQDRPHVEKELLFMKEDLNNEIELFTKKYSSFDNSTFWYYGGEELKKIKSPLHLEKHLSALMNKEFPFTPEVKNESFNRRYINSIQKNAAIKVVDYLINNYKEENIGIEGSGPDYLIYASTIKNTSINLLEPDCTDNVGLVTLRDRLLEKLNSSPRDNIQQIINILSEKPFGIRKPLIPIFLVSLLRDHWGKIIFYSNNMFVDTNSGANVYEMILNSDQSNYTYDFFDLDVKYDAVINDFNLIFKKYFSDQRTDDHIPIRLCYAMLNWFRELPRISQTTNNIDKEVVQFREIIRRSEVDPIKGIESVNQLYNKGNGKTYIESLKNRLESYYETHKENLEKIVFQKFNFADYHELKKWIDTLEEALKKNNPMVNVLANSDEYNWLERLCYALVGVERRNWTDTTNNTFVKQLMDEINKLSDKDLYYENAITISVADKQIVVNEVELSPKSILIYDNAKRIIKNGGRTVPKSELEYVLYKLFTEAFE